jgi:hypothetical protein
MRGASGTARQLHLARAARTAGEAFAFVEPEATAAGRRVPASVLVWAALGAVAAGALLIGF